MKKDLGDAELKYNPVEEYNHDLAYNQANVLGPIAVLKNIISGEVQDDYRQVEAGSLDFEQFKHSLKKKVASLLDQSYFYSVLEGIYLPYYDMDENANAQRLFHTPRHPDEISTLVERYSPLSPVNSPSNKMQSVRAAIRRETNGQKDHILANIVSYITNMLHFYSKDLTELHYMALLDLAAAGHDTIYHSDGKIKGETFKNLTEVLEEVSGSNGSRLQWRMDAKRDPKYKFLYKMLEHKNWAAIYDNPSAGAGPNEALSAINLNIYMSRFNIPEASQVKIITTVLNTKPFDDQISQYRFEVAVRKEYKLLQEIEQHKLLTTMVTERDLAAKITAKLSAIDQNNIKEQNNIDAVERKIELLFGLDRELGYDQNKFAENSERIIKEQNLLLFNAIRAGKTHKAKRIQANIRELPSKSSFLLRLNEYMEQCYHLQLALNQQKQHALQALINEGQYAPEINAALTTLITNYDTPVAAIKAGLDFTNLGDVSSFVTSGFLRKEKSFVAENYINLRKTNYSGYDFVQILHNANDGFYGSYLLPGRKTGTVAIFHAGPPSYDLAEAQHKNHIAAKNI